MRLSEFEALSFDCYGTLIDWETGIKSALQTLLSYVPKTPDENEVLELFGQLESGLQSVHRSWPYPRILEETHRQLAKAFDARVPDTKHRKFGESVSAWPAFNDTAEAMKYLKKHFKLVILSNVDRESFRQSNKHLGIEFDAIYTAEDIGSYKPDNNNFQYLINGIKNDLGIPKNKILHTAQSLFHDHVPAIALGLATAWIDRRHNQLGQGATQLPSIVPKVDFTFLSLQALVSAHASELNVV